MGFKLSSPVKDTHPYTSKKLRKGLSIYYASKSIRAGVPNPQATDQYWSTAC